MSELSRYSVRSLSETKPSDRTRKWPITLLGGKVGFYFIKISHSYYHLTSWCSFHSHFLPLWRLGVYVWATEDFFLLWKRSKICVPFRSLNFEHSCSEEFEATDSSKYNSTTPYCVRVDRQQFLVLTLSIEQMSSWLYSDALKTFDCCLVYSNDMTQNSVIV